MISYTRFIWFLALLFMFLTGNAQDATYVYQDTSIVSNDLPNVDTVGVDTNGQISEVEEELVIVPDTVLLANQLSVDADSVRALKNLSGLSYAKNLDSLLYEEQLLELKKKQLQQDDVSWLQRVLMSPLTKYFFWLLGIIFILFILSRLFFAEGFFQRAYARSAVKILASESDQLSPTADYALLISQAIRQDNFRLAIRYHYLQSLQLLAVKGLIAFSPDKTNNEYLAELTGKKYRKEFMSLTRNYEYAWYGEFSISADAFKLVQQQFKFFNASL